MEKTITLLNSLPFLLSALVWSALFLVVLIVGYHVYCGITLTWSKLKLGILWLCVKAKLWIQRCLLRKPETRYNCQVEQPSFATLTLSDLSPESNPVLPYHQKRNNLSKRATQRKGRRETILGDSPSNCTHLFVRFIGIVFNY
jgi:hypothetical protein